MKTSAGKRRRAIAFAAVAFAFVATGTYWLAAAGSSNFTIGAPPGLASDGSVADVVKMTTTVVRSNGGASLQTGKTIAKLKIAKDYTNRLRVSVIWTNPDDAAQVLSNPNSQIVIGLYRPVSVKGAGNCLTTDAIAVIDGGTTFCTVKDGSATGSSAVSSSGELMLSRELLSGFLRPAATPATSHPNCADVTDATGLTTWCQPTTTYVTADQRLLYMIAAITVPGGIPVGQQNQTGSLDFYVQAKLISST